MQLRKVTNFEATNTGLNKLHLITNERWIAKPKDSCKNLLELSITCKSLHLFLNNNIKFHIIKTYHDSTSILALNFRMILSILVNIQRLKHCLPATLHRHPHHHIYPSLLPPFDLHHRQTSSHCPLPTQLITIFTTSINIKLSLNHTQTETIQK
ncbi:hypothetical protein V6Z11_D01G149400 [Gossypium hirsutum]|uniref:Uncharacterized protein n=2 Tax=Gossypium TaxID=3633 RepID=A0A5D2M9M0_GOSTO|nr:hypothetical protein ES288_D01G156900v1 [Gossypium darwinii]TYH88006.1 hypothetical protein ES332_D01G157400v1 [Gossypium tomentosum]